MAKRLHQSHHVNNLRLTNQMPKQCTKKQHLSQHLVEYLLKQITIGKKSRKHNQPHDDSLVIHIWLQHLLSQLSNKLVLVSLTHIVRICHLLYNSMSPLTQGCCVGLIFSGLSGLPESFICQKRRSISCETYLADRNRHSIPSRFLSALSLRHKIGWCTPNHRPHHLMLTPAVILYPSPTITVLVMDN
jgi:hypothetical protein